MSVGLTNTSAKKIERFIHMQAMSNFLLNAYQMSFTLHISVQSVAAGIAKKEEIILSICPSRENPCTHFYELYGLFQFN